VTGPTEVVVRMLGPGDASVLDRVAAGVFDHDVVPESAREFLEDPRHHIAVALENERVVGMASGIHYVHPDKPAELWIDEVGVAPPHRRRGLAKELLRCLMAHGTALGCREAWVLTETENAPARSLYESLGARREPDPACYSFRLAPDEG
jgi:aminoglycoside 6'-N-acetyltransferase I